MFEQNVLANPILAPSPKPKGTETRVHRHVQVTGLTHGYEQNWVLGGPPVLLASNK